jgi:hypothetical protein
MPSAGRRTSSTWIAIIQAARNTNNGISRAPSTNLNANSPTNPPQRMGLIQPSGPLKSHRVLLALYAIEPPAVGFFRAGRGVTPDSETDRANGTTSYFRTCAEFSLSATPVRDAPLANQRPLIIQNTSHPSPARASSPPFAQTSQDQIVWICNLFAGPCGSL